MRYSYPAWHPLSFHFLFFFFYLMVVVVVVEWKWSDAKQREFLFTADDDAVPFLGDETTSTGILRDALTPSPIPSNQMESIFIRIESITRQ